MDQNRKAYRWIAGAAALLLSLPAWGWRTELDFNGGPNGAQVSELHTSDAIYSDERIYEGNFSSKHTISSGAEGFGAFGGIYDFPSHVTEGQELWVRVRVFWPDGFSWNANPWLKFLRIHTTDSGGSNHGYDDWYIDIDGSTHTHRFIYEGEQVWYRFGGKTNDPQHNTWETYEMYIKFDDVPASQGGQSVVRFWKNGVLIGETSDRETLNNSSVFAESFYIFTYWNGGAPQTQSMYVDDVIITTDTPNATDAAGNPYIGVGPTGDTGSGPIADNYYLDNGIENHPDVYLHTDFDDFGVSDWTYISGNYTISAPTEALIGDALHVTVPQGQHYGLDAGYGFADEGFAEPEEIYFRYYLRLGSNWTPGWDGKMPGPAGRYGSAGWGGRVSDGTNGWSARGLHLTEETGGEIPYGSYVYHADMGNWGAWWMWDINNIGDLEKERWYSLETYVKMNDPNQNNGILRGWVDGQLAFEKTDVSWTDVDSINIEEIWFNVYHGGDATAPNTMALDIDNVVIASSYIGPMNTDSSGVTVSSGTGEADINGYTALFERVLGDVPACDVTFTDSNSQTTIQNQLNGTDSDRVFCFTAGDYRGYTLSLTRSGSSSDRRWIRLAGDGVTPPWQLASNQQAKMPDIDFDGADWWVIHRVTWDGDNVYERQFIEFNQNSGADFNVLNRVLIEQMGATSGSSTHGVMIREGNEDNTIQNSVLRNFETGSNAEPNGITIFQSNRGSQGTRIINNQMYNLGSGAIFLYGSGADYGMGRTVIENNDIYITPATYTNCNGSFTTGGGCSTAEKLIEMKRGGESMSEDVKIIHNRMWGIRSADQDVCCLGGSAGLSISITSNDTGDNGGARYVLAQDNIIFDGQIGINQIRNQPNNWSAVGNIFWDIQDFANENRSFGVQGSIANSAEIVLNTFIDNEQWTNLDSATSTDVLCNVVIESGGENTDGGSNTVTAWNAFYGTSPNGRDYISRSLNTWSANTNYSTGSMVKNSGGNGYIYKVKTDNGGSGSSEPSWCTTLGCEIADGGLIWRAIRAPYSFYRKLQTGPELVSIPYAVMDVEAPENGTCPGAGHADRVGSRSGVGVNNDLSGW